VAIRIDAHQHFWRYSPRTHAWIEESMGVLKRDFLPEDLRPLLAAGGYAGAVAVQAATTVEETDWLLDLADAHPFIAGVVGWVDLCAPDVAGVLDRLVTRRKLRGVRHILQSEPEDFSRRADFRRGIAALVPRGLTYDILIYPHQLAAAADLVAAFPEQKFVVDHLAKPDVKAGAREPWGREMRALARHPNAWCKLSGLVTEADWRAWRPEDLAPYLDAALEAFGPGRLMIGSDWPVCTLAGEHRRVMAVVEDHVAHLPAPAADSVLGETARAFYGLAAAPSP
jgi:L-fuconolactonase